MLNPVLSGPVVTKKVALTSALFNTSRSLGKRSTSFTVSTSILSAAGTLDIFFTRDGVRIWLVSQTF